MYQRVLVPLDGSMLSESALIPALHLAQQKDGTLYLMRVPVYAESGEQDNPEYQPVWTADHGIPEHEDTAVYLREIRERFALPGVSIKTVVGEGERVSAILNTASEKDIDLIVMASHARSGVSRWLLGSIAAKVIRRSRIPVLLVRRPPPDFDHILITLDGSNLAERIIEPALELAAGFGSRITLLQIRSDRDETGAGPNKVNQADGRRDSYLDKIRARYAERGLVIGTAVGTGSPAAAILAHVAEKDVDLVAMSTHGRSGLRKLVFGSVTEKVLCDCENAMLVVCPANQDTNA